MILPDLYLFENSFRPYLPVVEMGGPKDFYSLDNYLTFFQSPIHLQVFFSTIVYSSVVTVLCFVIAYPLAYYLAKVARQQRCRRCSCCCSSRSGSARSCAPSPGSSSWR